MSKASQTIQDIKVSKIHAPSSQYPDQYSVIITYDNTIYTNTIHESLFESKFYGWDLFENLILNGINKNSVCDIECETKCNVDKEKKVLKIVLMLTLDKKPMKKITEEFTFKLNEKILDYDDKIALTVANLKTEINLPVLHAQGEIQVYCYNFQLYKSNHEKCTPSLNIFDITKSKFILWMPDFDATKPTEFQSMKSLLNSNENFHIYRNSVLEKLKIKNFEFEILRDLIDEKDRTIMVNADTDFNKYMDLYNYVKKINNLEFRLYEKLIENATGYINYIQYYKNKLILFVNNTRNPIKRKIKFYKSYDEFIINQDKFKNYIVLQYDETLSCIIVEEQP